MSTGTVAEDELIACWIVPNPEHPGPADARVLPGYVSAWVVIGQLQLDYWKPEAIAEGYDLPEEAVRATVAYYRRHQEAIDARIAEHRASFHRR